jgi:molecular chaperone GrpE (heat shock protein)
MQLMQRFSTAWRALVCPASPPAATDDEPTVALRRDLAATRLDLQETTAALTAERARLAALEQAQAAQVHDRVESQLEVLFAALAAPLSQLRLQAALLDAGTAVAATDVMALARRCVAEIERAGLEPIGATEEVVRFDPALAQPLMEGVQMAPGDEVRVRFVGYRYHGRVLRKALVERKEA